MISASIQFILSALLIVVAGSFLTKFADRISDITGWGKIFVGSLLLAGATSIPELMVDLKSVEMNLPDLAAGDLLGSSLFNLLILSTLDFAFPSKFRGTAFSPVFIRHSLSAVLAIVLTGIAGMGIASKLNTSFLGISIFSYAILITYLFGIRLIYLEGKNDSNSTQKNRLNIFNNGPLLLAVLGYTSCAILIFIVAPYLVESADNLARLSGFGHTFIGTTLVALSTSLPELVATIAAFRIGAPDLALGNIFGSNTFNMILFVPLDFMSPGIIFNSVRSTHLVTAFSIITATSIALMGQLYRRKKEDSRLSGPSSELVVVVIFLSLFLLYSIKSAAN